MDIRVVVEQDREVFADLLTKLDNETSFMLFEPGERHITGEIMKNRINGMNKSGSAIIGGFEDDKMAGFVMLSRGQAKRIEHSGYIVLGILQEYSGMGLGTRLMRRIEEWSRTEGLTRLELTVMCHNSKAYKLYEKQGYVTEGVKKNSLIVDGEYIDEYYMGKIL